MPTKPSNSADPIIKRLRSLAKDSPELKDAILHVADFPGSSHP